MVKKNVNPILGFFGALILSVVTFFLGAIEYSLIIISATVVLIIADYCREQKSNVWVVNLPTNLDLFKEV